MNSRSGEIVEAHHQPRLVAIQQAPEDRPGDDAREVEAEDDEAHRRTRAGHLQHEPEQGDEGELVPEIRDAQPQPEPLERAIAQWSANALSGLRHAWRLGLNHLPQVAIGITEVKPLDARARAIQVILHFVDLDALCFELVVRRFNI